MPELPEVETVVRGLRQPLCGHEIVAAKVFSKKVRTPVPPALGRLLSGATVLEVARRAKYILIHLGTGNTLIIHLGMTGSLQLRSPDMEPFRPGRHDHLWFRLGSGTEIVFSDPRRFGVIDLAPTAELQNRSHFVHLGPEPLERSFTGTALTQRLKGRKTAIKLALMNQEIVVGVGNIYASEALFKAGISPLREAGKLRASEAETLCGTVKTVLRASIRAGGSTLRDYRQASGELGFFQNRFAVYDREGQGCPGCTCKPEKTGGIMRITQGGRSTFYCPRKQK